VPSSIRSQAINAIVATIAAVNGTSDYFTDLTGPKVVSLAQEAAQKRRDLGLPIIIRVRDSIEETRRADQHSALDSRLEVIIEVFVRAGMDEVVVDKANNVIHDVRLALDRNTQLGGVVYDCFITTIGEPEYDFDSRFASFAMVATVRYDMMQGITA
jgi:hypothetical protein